MTEITSRLSTALADRYKIERRLGQGGMATVYLAQDLKHDRKVAIKVLRPELAAVLGAERFVQEIKTTANLQHPHILPLYDSGRTGGAADRRTDDFLYYVMPYIDGETLRDKLNREKQLGIDEAVKIATEVADALDYAHRHSVIHRDIKPENILLHDGRPLVADFGIALAVSAAAGGRMTETGLSLGTPHYMSPEQATAEKDLTSRSDIYSLGAVLYEMLTGDPPHMGNSAQQVIMKIVTDIPRPVTDLRKSVPPNVAAATANALEKLAADRFESAATFAEALANATFTTQSVAVPTRASSSNPWKRVSLSLGVVTTVMTIAAAWALVRPPAPKPVLRYRETLPTAMAPRTQVGWRIAISPDGQTMAYVAGSAQGGRLVVRSRHALTGTELPGTEGALTPFFSPAGDRLGFVTTNPSVLKVVSVTGGVPITVVDSAVGRGGASWGRDGFIYFDGEGGSPILRVPVNGGAIAAVTVLDPARGERSHNAPFALPNGNGVLYMLRSTGAAQVAVVNLATGTQRVLASGTMPVYVTLGHLVYVNPAGVLMAVPFDQDGLAVTGQPVAIAQNVDLRDDNWWSDVAISATGTLMYMAQSDTDPLNELVWVTRDGTAEVIDPDWRAEFSSVAPSPDGTQLAAAINQNNGSQIWIKRLDPPGAPYALTFAGASSAPHWSPDGRVVIFASGFRGFSQSRDLYRKRADGSEDAQLLVDTTNPIGEGFYSRDGDRVVYRTGFGLEGDLYTIRPGIDSTATPLVATSFLERSPALSPDGRWLAYVSNELGREEVFVLPFPEAGTKRLVSSNGGVEPSWSRDGRELFYVDRNNMLVASQIAPGATFAVLEHTPLFSVAPYLRPYDVTGDGRFVMVRASAVGQLIVVENWFEELKENRR